ncbi:hypothetical protein MAPG_10713 [Magnaporthiopsis poae ATCC 64411]|uniref:Uncharacterized protein n=1 Tax=Magnaporthiopsis poae (strain ATCC 64411 / 73-15) TaxID=644358 RepID=A0A0C4EDB8_MAGP6|nr:hypothetical protein MAPG_10713 [Magnaporthiopsis poae ATCC 64411]
MGRFPCATTISSTATSWSTRTASTSRASSTGKGHTVPWELIAFPEFIQAMPVSFDLPQKYDRDGQPLDEEARQTWRERQEYVEMVRSAELEDHLLSTCLGSNRSQALAYAYGAFTSTGKLGFYDRVIEEVERES